MEFRRAGTGPKQDQIPESNVKYSVHFLNAIRMIMSPDGSVPIHHCYSDYIRIWNRFCCFVLILVLLCCPGCLECLLSLPSASFLPHLCLSQWSGIYHIMKNNTLYAVFSFCRIPSLSRLREATHTTKRRFEGEELQESNVGLVLQTGAQLAALFQLDAALVLPDEAENCRCRWSWWVFGSAGAATVANGGNLCSMASFWSVTKEICSDGLKPILWMTKARLNPRSLESL